MLHLETESQARINNDKILQKSGSRLLREIVTEKEFLLLGCLPSIDEKRSQLVSIQRKTMRRRKTANTATMCLTSHRRN